MEGMKMNREKKEVFFRIARDLRGEFSFVPILYGSLGVSLATGGGDRSKKHSQLLLFWNTLTFSGLLGYSYGQFARIVRSLVLGKMVE